jgi:hypothetical protein
MPHYVAFSALLCMLHNFSAYVQQGLGTFCIWKIQLSEVSGKVFHKRKIFLDRDGQLFGNWPEI